MSSDKKRYFTDTELPAEIDNIVATATLRKDRIGARRIPFIKLGGKVVYDIEAVRAALSALSIGGGSAQQPSRKRAA